MEGDQKELLEMVHEFPMAALTKYHKLSVLTLIC